MYAELTKIAGKASPGHFYFMAKQGETFAPTPTTVPRNAQRL